MEISYNFQKEVMDIESHWVVFQYLNIVSNFSIIYNCGCLIVADVKIGYNIWNIVWVIVSKLKSDTILYWV